MPGLGSLSLTTLPANTDISNKNMTAPAHQIMFNEEESNSGELISYLSQKTQSNTFEAAAALDHYCDGLKNALAEKKTAAIEGTGMFEVDDSGKLIFTAKELPPAFLPQVQAERVIHPETEHQMLVGDKETTNIQMAEYFNVETVTKDRWWIWAVLLGVIGLLAVLIYLNDADNSSLLGNAVKI